mgnify:CR=1 FL=1
MNDYAFSYSGKLAYLQRVSLDARLTKSAVAVAAVLLNYADRQSGKAYPSIDRLVAESGVARSTCIRAVALLEKCDHLSAARRVGANTQYILAGVTGETGVTPGTSVIQEQTGVIQNLRRGPTGVTTGTDPVSPSGPELEVEAKAIGKELDTRAREGRFAEFWDAYPRHEGGRANCEKAWTSKKLDREADRILGDIRARLADLGQWKTIEKRFIPHPKTYLHQRRWEDEWTPTKAATGQLPREPGNDDDIAALNEAAALRMGGGR